MTARRKAGTPTSMIARVALVLDAVEGHSLTAVSEVARDTGLPKATVSRLVLELLAHDFLTREEHLIRSGRRMMGHSRRSSIQHRVPGQPPRTPHSPPTWRSAPPPSASLAGTRRRPASRESAIRGSV